MILLGTLGVAITYSQVDLRKAWEMISGMSGDKLFIYIILVCVNLILISFRWKIILDASRIKLPPLRIFAYYLGGFSISHLTPFSSMGGEPVRAYLLKRHQVPFDKGFSMVTIDRALELSVNVVLSVFAIMVTLGSLAVPVASTLQVIVAVMVLLVLIFVFHYRMFRRKFVFFPIVKLFGFRRYRSVSRLAAWFRSMERHMHNFYINHTRVYFQAIALQTVLWCFMVVEFYVVMLLLNMDASILLALVMLLASAVSSLFPIPGALGAMEAALVSAVTALGGSKEGALAVSVILRFRYSLMSLCGIILLIYLGITWRRVVEISNGNNNKRGRK